MAGGLSPVGAPHPVLASGPAGTGAILRTPRIGWEESAVAAEKYLESDWTQAPSHQRHPRDLRPRTCPLSRARITMLRLSWSSAGEHGTCAGRRRVLPQRAGLSLPGRPPRRQCYEAVRKVGRFPWAELRAPDLTSQWKNSSGRIRRHRTRAGTSSAGNPAFLLLRFASPPSMFPAWMKASTASILHELGGPEAPLLRARRLLLYSGRPFDDRQGVRPIERA